MVVVPGVDVAGGVALDPDPGNVVIGVVPSQGTKSFQGKLIAVDAERDLALIEVVGPHLPSWKKGPRSVRDGRGPRDTYG